MSPVTPSFAAATDESPACGRRYPQMPRLWRLGLLAPSLHYLHRRVGQRLGGIVTHRRLAYIAAAGLAISPAITWLVAVNLWRSFSRQAKN